MSAREALFGFVEAGAEEADLPTFAAAVDAYRAEILAEAKVEVVAWLVKKDREDTPVGRLASKVDRGAVRIFLGTGHYRDAMDAHRAEVLAEVEALLANMTTEADQQTEAMEGEGADSASLMYAQHIGLRRACDAVRRLAGEKATAAAATATPEFFQRGHRYTHRDGNDFQCVEVTAHPQTGERIALGWHVDGWGWHYPAAVGINQWNHEYDGVKAPSAPEAGEVRG